MKKSMRVISHFLMSLFAFASFLSCVLYATTVEGTTLPPPLSLYVVVDLSGGATATSYPVTELSAVPTGGWTNEYKTAKLVLRRIEAGTFMMGSPADELGRIPYEDLHQVTLTEPYYIGVFEVTQKQWTLVMGNNPSWYKGDAHAHPVERVTYSNIRGINLGAQWPASAEVDATSFMGKLSTKTSLEFDLPTDAQWEDACRAGTTTALNSGKDLTDMYECPNMNVVGYYQYNRLSNAIGQFIPHTTVGSYAPNAWGLYDMHGNVNEWCLDWWDGFLGTAPVIDPVGATSNPNNRRIFRGGSGHYDAHLCRSALRSYGNPTYPYNNVGLRVALPFGQ